jgi:hypothetical protein
MEVLMTKPLTFQIIARAKELIQDERHWCRGYMAIDERGVGVDPTSKQAVKRCALGALLAAAYELVNDKTSAYELGVNALHPLCGSNGVVVLNDHSGHAAVVALFDAVLARA